MDNTIKIAGCRHIAESIKSNPIWGGYYSELIAGSEGSKATFGKQPNMPNPSIKPIKVVSNYDNVCPELEGLEAKWIQVSNLDRYGVYHNVIALFGDHHWVTRERNGAVCLRIFTESFD